MFKKILLVLGLIFYFSLPKLTFAISQDTFVTITNPIRGLEGWGVVGRDPLALPKFQYQEATASALPITWALRYDVLNNATMSSYFQKLVLADHTQSIGAFLEITPRFAADAGASYQPGFSIFNANRIFLSGYTQNDRLKLIDLYMTKFFSLFGFYPRSVVAWDLDSYSLSYLQTKYSVLIAMNCDEQYSTDNYRFWGGYIGSPYFPDKNNALLPARSLDNRINLALVRWAQRDLYNFFGSGPASLHSVQLNDYQKINQKTTYFEALIKQYSQKVFNEFGYLNLGLENDDDLKVVGPEIKNMYRVLLANKEKYGLHFISLSEFGDWLKAVYPESSPAYFYRTTDPTSKENGETFWYQSPFYRIGLKSIDGQTKIIDYRVYNREIIEAYYAVPNQQTTLYQDLPSVIDSVKYPKTELTLDLDLTRFETVHNKFEDMWQVALVSGNQQIIFTPAKIQFQNIKIPDIHDENVKVSHKSNLVAWEATPQTPFKDRLSNYKVLIVFLTLLGLYFLPKRPPFKKEILFGLVLSLLIGLTLFRNGLYFSYGQDYYGPNGHDAIFHLSLIQKFAHEPFNLNHPQFSGAKLANYHLIFDYLSGLITKVLSLPVTTLYFRLFPLVFSFLLVILLSHLMTQLAYSVPEKLIGYLLVFLGGSLGFIPKLLTHQDFLSGESAFWANQSASMFLNPPFVVSIVFLLYFLTKINRKNDLGRLDFVKLALIGGLLAQTKVYAFILLVLALLFNKKYKLLLAVCFFGVLISLPFLTISGSPFLFEPFWFLKSLFASFDRFYWPRMVSAWQTYESSGNLLKLVLLNVLALIIFMVGNLNVRLFGLFSLLKNQKPSLTLGLIKTMILFGLIIPLFVVQKLNPWNTIQFMYYSIFFLGLISAPQLWHLGEVIRNKFAFFALLSAILFIGIFTSFGTLKDYFGQFSPARISYVELQALKALSSQPQGIVLSPLYQPQNNLAVPKPLYAYVSNAYISGYTGQPEYLSDTINLDITGFDYTQKSRLVQRFYQTENKAWAKDFLDSQDIGYVYETQLAKMKLNYQDLCLAKIFDSGEINIYKFNCHGKN